MSGLKQEWLNDSEFKDWLSGIPDDDFFYCKLCDATLKVNGKSSLQKHAIGTNHKLKSINISKVGSSSQTSASVKPKPAAPGSAAANININLINAQGIATAPDTQQTISTQGKKQANIAVSGKMRPPTDVQPSKSKNNSNTTSIFTKNQLKKTLNEMFDEQNKRIKKDIADVLNLYKEPMNSDDHSQIKRMLDNYKSKAKQLTQDTEADMLKCSVLR